MTGVAVALDEYRELLRHDGADLELTGVEAGTVSVRLLLGDDTCQDCVLSKDMLETILLDGLRRQDARVVAVVVADPRVA